MGNGKTYNRSLLGFLLSADLIAGFFAFSIGFKVNILNGEAGLLTWFIFSEILWISLFALSNLYDTRATLSRFEEILRIVPTVYFTLIFIITGQVMNLYLLPFELKQILVYGFILSGFLILGRILIHTIQKLLLKQNIGLKKAVILGVNRRGIDVYDKLQTSYHHGLAIAGFVQANDDPDISKHSGHNIDILGSEQTINQIITKNQIDDVIIALDKPSPERIMDTIMNVNGHPVSMKILPDMYEVVTGLARTNQLVGVPLIDVNLNLDTLYSKHLKRIIDIFIATISLISIFPFWILIALGIKIDSKGPILYKQERIGMDGEKFLINKFRTMVLNAEDDTGPVWSGKDDSRITSFGSFLRRFHLDETPQLINIIFGDMASIGPRPERPYFIERLEKKYPFYKRRLKIRPGVSGWAQIKQPYDEKYEDVHQKLKYDFFYIENLSFRLDLKILLGTFWVTIFGHSR
ncbi:MAG: sugar transferase [Candidatus Marinimicrobia bacterium]|nr:sugar transferase [Candidatus Neomarinimicrobiota bacterium]